MMGKFNKLTKSLAMIGLVALTTNTNAGESTGTITFGTILDVAVSEVTPVHFGDNYLLASGLSCTLVYLGDVTSGTTKKPVEGTAAGRSGTACGLSTATQAQVGGLFLIEGAPLQAVKVKVTGATENDLQFVAAGNVVPGDPALDAFADIADTEVTFADDQQVTIALSQGESFGVASNKGFASIYVGGTLTAQADLASSATLTVNYNVEVIY